MRCIILVQVYMLYLWTVRRGEDRSKALCEFVFGGVAVTDRHVALGSVCS